MKSISWSNLRHLSLGVATLVSSSCSGASSESEASGTPRFRSASTDPGGDTGLDPGTASEASSSGGGVDLIGEAVDDADKFSVSFERRTVRLPNGAREEESDGELGLATLERVARPGNFALEEILYSDEFRIKVGSDGTTETWHRVREQPNHAPTTTTTAAQPGPASKLHPRLLTQIDSAAPGQSLRVALKLAGYPPWDVPIVPDPRLLSAGELELARLAREQGLAARADAFDAAVASLENELLQRGGTVTNRVWTSGWLVADLGVESILAISQHPDVAAVDADEVDMHGLTADNEQIRERDACDLETFWDSGYYGTDDNGDHLVAAVIEWQHFNDEACFLGEGASCLPTRVRNIFECGFGSCTYTSNANYNWSANVAHGTAVTSLLMGDYTTDQADGFDVCDPSCLVQPCDHESGFEERSTGAARDAEIDYFDLLANGSQTSMSAAVQCAQGITSVSASCDEADVISQSISLGPQCDVTSSSLVEDEMENAFDDGLMVINGAGNEGALPGCLVVEPADTPKVFSVNGIDLTDDPYATAPIHSESSALGGGDVVVNGKTYVGALTLNDLAAPAGGIRYNTQSSSSDPDVPPRGCSLWSSSVGGTSAATPIVAGSALILKGQLLGAGDYTIGFPGRLHAMMLMMGDRAHTGGSGQLATGGDDSFGFGRLKMRLVESGAPSSSPGELERRTYTFTSGTNDIEFHAFGGLPLPVGAELLKCVSFQAEDMSAKSDFSRVTLEVQLRMPFNGSCAINRGTLSATRADNSYDNKRSVVYKDESFTLGGRCVEVTLDKRVISTGGSVTVHTVCGYFSEIDNEPN